MRLIVLATLLVIILASCTKEKIVEKEVEKIVYLPTPGVNKDSVLTVDTLKIEEIRFLQGNTQYYYKRGASSGNTANFDTEYIKFNANNTGTYFVTAGMTYTLTWNWVDAAKTKIQYVVSYPTPLTVIWDQLQFTNNSLAYSEYYNRTGSQSMGYAVRKHY